MKYLALVKSKFRGGEGKREEEGRRRRRKNEKEGKNPQANGSIQPEVREEKKRE